MRMPMRAAFAEDPEDTPQIMPRPAPPPAAAALPAPRRRGGMFGGAMRALNPFDQEASFGDFLLGGYDRVDRLRGLQQEAQQQKQIDAFIGGLPVEQQALARIAPEAVAKARVEQMYSPPAADEFGAADGFLYNKRTGETRQLGTPQRKFFNTGQAVVEVDPQAGTARAIYEDPQRPSATRDTWRAATPDEIESFGLPAGVAAQISSDGKINVITKQRQYTEFAGKAAEFANRMAGAGPGIDQIELKPGFRPELVWSKATAATNQDAKSYRTYMREWLAALLRKDTGAAVTDSEFDFYGQTYFPVPGDTPQQVEAKRQARARALNGVKAASQGAYDEWFGDVERAPAGAKKGAPPPGDYEYIPGKGMVPRK